MNYTKLQLFYNLTNLMCICVVRRSLMKFHNSYSLCSINLQFWPYRSGVWVYMRECAVRSDFVITIYS